MKNFLFNIMNFFVQRLSLFSNHFTGKHKVLNIPLFPSSTSGQKLCNLSQFIITKGSQNFVIFPPIHRSDSHSFLKE